MSDGLAATIVIAIVMTLIIGFALGTTRLSCASYGEVTGRQVEFRVFGGCFAQADDGRWYPYDKIWDEGTPR